MKRLDMIEVFIFACLSWAHGRVLRKATNESNSTRELVVNCNLRGNKCQPITLRPDEYFEQNEILVADNYNSSVTERMSGDNVTCCFPYKREFDECIKWKLDSSEFEIVRYQLFEKKAKNNRQLALGEYRLNGDDSAFVCVPCSSQPWSVADELDLLFLAFCIASTVSVGTCLASYLICPFRRHDSKSVICHMISLLGAHLVRLIFQTAPAVTYRVYFCTLIEFFTLASNNWLNVISYDVWTKFNPKKKSSKADSSKRRAFYWCWCCCYAWGLACVLLVVEFVFVGVLDETLLIAPGIYAFTWSSIYYFVCLTLMQSVNVVSFLITRSNIEKMKTETETTKNYVEVNEKIICQYKQLFLVISIVYVLVLLQRIPIHVYVSASLDFLLVMQGFYFFLIYRTNELNLILKQCCHKLRTLKNK